MNPVWGSPALLRSQLRCPPSFSSTDCQWERWHAADRAVCAVPLLCYSHRRESRLAGDIEDRALLQHGGLRSRCHGAGSHCLSESPLCPSASPRAGPGALHDGSPCTVVPSFPLAGAFIAASFCACSRYTLFNIHLLVHCASQMDVAPIWILVTAEYAQQKKNPNLSRTFVLGVKCQPPVPFYFSTYCMYIHSNIYMHQYYAGKAR